MFRRISATLAIPVALALGVTACGGAADDLLPEDVAAEVNGAEIPVDTLNGIVATVVPEEATPEETVDAERNVLSSLIQSTIAVDAAADEGIELSEDELDELASENSEQVATEAEQFGMSEEDYVTYVLEPNEVVRRLYAQLGEAIPDDEVQAAYDQLVASGQTEVATISHILVESEVEAVDALARIAGGESFEDVAADVSIDGSAASGGALGEDVPLSNYVAPFADAAREATIGEITDPVETEFGWHLLRVDSRTTQSFEDVEPQLREQAAQGDAQEFLGTAFAEAEVVVPSRIGVWDGEVTGVVAEEQVGEAPAVVEDAPTGDVPTGDVPTSDATE